MERSPSKLLEGFDKDEHEGCDILTSVFGSLDSLPVFGVGETNADPIIASVLRTEVKLE